jgi:glycosyltransferase involved in cell wall biosynthesis
MSTSAPRFSIVMPAYNAAATIGDAIESVLTQEGFEDWELVITDDGSTDDTLAIARGLAALDPRISVVTQPNAGAGAAVSAAVARATGDFVVRLDSDDRLLPGFCARMDEVIAAHPGFDIYAMNAYQVDPRGRRSLFHDGPLFQREFSLTVDGLLDAPMIYVSAVFRREWFDRVGGLRSVYNEDYDFWLRLLIAGARHFYTPEPLALYRISPGQKTADAVRVREGDITVLRDAITAGGLTPEQVAHGERTIALLERNVAFRRRVLGLVGPKIAQSIFVVAHRLAWFVRPHRRRRD